MKDEERLEHLSRPVNVVIVGAIVLCAIAMLLLASLDTIESGEGMVVPAILLSLAAVLILVRRSALAPLSREILELKRKLEEKENQNRL